MISRLFPMIALLLVTSMAGAQVRHDEDGCKRETVTASPEGMLAGGAGCHEVTNKFSGAKYRFQGIIGETTGWVLLPGGGPTCGDAIINVAGEQCDAPGGIGQVGVCATLGNCGADCRCISAPSLCGNGTWDSGSGEACDPTAQDDTPCPQHCTSACQCACVCGDGLTEIGCASGTNETCEFVAGAAGTNFLTALDGTGGRVDTNLDTPFDFTNHEIIWEFFLQCRTQAIPATQRLFWKSGVAIGSVGWNIVLLTNGQLRLQAADGTNAATATSPLSTVVAGQRYHFAITRSAANVVTVQRLNQTAGESTHTPVTVTTSGTTPPTSWADLTSWGTNAVELNLLARADGTEPAACVLEEARIRSDANGGTDITTAFLATGMEADWDDQLITGSPAITARWGFNESSTSALTESVTGTIATPSGSLGLITSPFSTATATTEIGCTAPQSCDPQSCVCKDPGTSGARTFYVATNGIDTAAGTTGAPWATFLWATCGNAGCNNPNRLVPGDTLIVKDGTYTEEINLDGGCGTGETGPACACNGIGANTNCGTAASPITIRAENKRKAFINADGLNPAVRVDGLAYWNIDGLRGDQADNPADKTGDNHNFFTFRSHHLTFTDTLANLNGRCGNNHLYKTVDSTDITYIRAEGWRHSRHGWSCSGSERIVLRDPYMNQAGRGVSGDSACLTNGMQLGGTSMESYTFYPCTDSTIENATFEGAGAWGYNVAGGYGSLGGKRASVGNLGINVIGGAPYLCHKMYSRSPDTRGIFQNTTRHLLCVNPSGIGVRHSVGLSSVIDRVGIIGAGDASFTSDDPGSTSCAPPASVSQCRCQDITSGTPESSVTVTDSIFTNGMDEEFRTVNCASTAAMACTISNVRADANTCASECSAACGSGITTTIPSGYGITSTNCPFTTTAPGPDTRCRYVNRVRQTGTTGDMFCPDTTACPGATATCTGTTAAGAVTPCLGGLKNCGDVVTGVNDTTDCRTFAHRHLNQLAGGTGCPLAGLACP